MAIKETKFPDGRWQREYTGEDVGEAFNQGLQEYGAKKFHESYMNDLKIGAETLIGPNGQREAVRADQVDASLNSGYSPMNRPRTVMPSVPWPKKPMKPGAHRYRYNPVTREMEEV